MYPDNFINEPSKRTPWIIMEPGKIFIMGRSIPENPGDFYRPIQEWVSKYAHNNNEKTVIEFGFEYINTSSTKLLVDDHVPKKVLILQFNLLQIDPWCNWQHVRFWF